MMAWMNEEALRLTLAEKRTVYWSRSRKCLWRKGETSGDIQHLIAVQLDCDGDTLLLQVNKSVVAPAIQAAAPVFLRARRSGLDIREQ